MKNFKKLIPLFLLSTAVFAAVGTYDSVRVKDLTASKLVTTDANKFLTSGSTGIILNADINASAAIARSKIASGTAYHLLGNDSGGALTSYALTNGQLLIGSTGAAPVAATLTGTTNQVVVTGGAGSITLSTPQNINTTSSPTFAGLTLNGDITYTNQHASIYREQVGNGTDAVTVEGPDAITTGYTIKLPSAQGGSGECMQNNGSGVLTWAACSGGGGGSMAIGSTVTSGTANSVLFVDGSGNLGQDNAAFAWGNANKKLTIASGSTSSGIGITVSTTNTGASGAQHGAIEATTTLANASAFPHSAISGRAIASVGGGSVIGIQSSVSAGGQSSTDGSAFFVDSNSENWGAYYGLYISGASSGTVTGDNHAIHVDQGTSYFGGTVLANSSILPTTTNSKEIGSVSKTFATVYTNAIDSTTGNIPAPIDVSGYTLNAASAGTSLDWNGRKLKQGSDTVLDWSSVAAFTFPVTATDPHDTVKLSVKGHSTQTSDIFLVEKSDGTDVLNVTNVNGTKIRGTTTNDDAAAGFVGEYIECIQSSNTNFPTSGQYGDVCNLTLTAGDWDLSWEGYFVANGATASQVIFGVGTASGNSGTGVSTPRNAFAMNGTYVSDTGYTHANIRESLSGSTTFYLKTNSTYTVATPQYRGIMHARRVR